MLVQQGHTTMTQDDEPAGASDSGASLLIKAVCCVIAADGRISGSEIDVVFDALAAIGLRQTPDAFRELVIKTCKEIHCSGVFVVADSLCESLSTLDGPLARLLIQLQGDVIESDGRITESEKAVAKRFCDAVSAKAALPPPLPEKHPTNAPNSAAAGLHDCLNARVALTTFENLVQCILNARKWVDDNVGSRALIVVCATVVAGAISVLAIGRLAAMPAGAFWGFVVMATVFFLGADNRLRSMAVDAPRTRGIEAAFDAQAAALAATLQIPPALSTAGVVVPDASEPEDGAGDAEGERKGFDTALGLVANPSWPTPYRAKLARRVLGILRGSKQRGIGRSACRCTSCGRKYWFVLFNANGNGVICPYCGTYQRAALDWEPDVLPPRPTVLPPSFWSRPVSAPSYTGGPVYVRGYVNKRGKWINSHTRARPRRRRW